MKVSVKPDTKRKAQKNTGSTIAQSGTMSDGRSERLSQSGSRKRNFKERVGVAKGIVTHLLSESQWNRGHFSMKKWESEKHKSWGIAAEGFMGHVATNGSLLGRADKCGACGWAVVQLNYDEEMLPLHGIHG